MLYLIRKGLSRTSFIYLDSTDLLTRMNSPCLVLLFMRVHRNICDTIHLTGSFLYAALKPLGFNPRFYNHGAGRSI